jgi:uncharacterized protein YbjT (DUF2867 family)
MKVLIFGATGLVGEFLMHACLQNPRIKQVTIFVRKKIALEHTKLTQVICALDTVEQVADQITGDVVFNCLGTTLKQAGSEAAQYAVDCTYPVKVAQIAAQNGIKCMVNVSSVGTSATGNFYLRTKAEMEAGISAAIGAKAYFMRPSFLTGPRKEVRIGEKIGIGLSIIINPLMFGGLRKYRSISAFKVAQAMIGIAMEQPEAPKVLHYDEIMHYAKKW